MMSSRKDFIAIGAALTALAPLFEAPRRASAAPISGAIPPLHFDLASFETTLASAATHRHLFASKLTEDGDVFDAIENTMNAYRSIGTPFSAIFPVAVLYHVAISLAFDDAVWNEILIPAASQLPAWIRMTLPTVLEPGSGNPYLHPAAGARNDDLASIDALLAQTRVQFYVCNNALYGFSMNIAGLIDESPGTTYARLTEGLVPRATVVPAGVWAVHAVQERGFTLLQTSL